MNELTNVPGRAEILRLEAIMREMPQSTDLVTEHNFSEGMYARKVWRPAGTTIVGKVHLKPHLFICAMGEILVLTETGTRTLKAGDVLESQAGTKRVTYAVTDAIGITVHRTDKTDLDEIEAELIEPDAMALFDARNELRRLT
jgi:quercetin dioxygenase-like cupin family protein